MSNASESLRMQILSYIRQWLEFEYIQLQIAFLYEIKWDVWPKWLMGGSLSASHDAIVGYL